MILEISGVSGGITGGIGGNYGGNWGELRGNPFYMLLYINPLQGLKTTVYYYLILLEDNNTSCVNADATHGVIFSVPVRCVEAMGKPSGNTPPRPPDNTPNNKDKTKIMK